ncbi:hypothetical protein [Acetobacter pasteurianus]|uniref:hypothetical protein n=1 Tax=Acetobacter pasteurianus TaxID=438 RepID=UPI0003843166|nr:hypothetical protein [Acetobacter pasteurianus]CCT60164.1 hypothetical protein APA386B_2115 [Acetobacter pasteurianus 386B]
MWRVCGVGIFFSVTPFCHIQGVQSAFSYENRLLPGGFLGFANANMAGLRLSSDWVMICAKIAQILAQDAVLLP